MSREQRMSHRAARIKAGGYVRGLTEEEKKLKSSTKTASPSSPNLKVAQPFSVDERVKQIQNRKKQMEDVLEMVDGTKKKKKAKVATPY